MFAECVNGLLSRLQSDSDIDMNDPDSEIVASKIPIGIVPAGNYVKQIIIANLKVIADPVLFSSGDKNLA